MSSQIMKLLVPTCLILVNFLNSFQEMGIEGVIPLIQHHYDIKDAETAAIMTASSIMNTTSLAFVWLFGDIFKRRTLFLLSVSCWIFFNALSLILGSTSFMIFVVFRALGAATSSIFVILVPVILADLLHDHELGFALMCLSVSDIASIMLTGIVSSWIVTSTIPWQSGMLTATVMSILPLVVLFYLRNNIRNVQKDDHKQGVRRIFSSAFGMLSVKSYLFITAEASLSSLHRDAENFWFPSVYLLAYTNTPEIFFGLSYPTITTLNSGVMLAGTLIGVPTVLWIAQSWRYGTGPCSSRASPRAYPIVTCIGAVLNIVVFFMSIMIMNKSFIATLANNFFIGFVKSNGLAIGQQILFAVIPSTSRAAAVALRQLISGVVGIPSAQIVGIISDSIRGDSMQPDDRFHAYQLVLLSTSIFMVLGVVCHVLLIVYYPGDCERAEEKDREEQKVNDERTLLIPKDLTDSIVDVSVRSRTISFNSGCL